MEKKKENLKNRRYLNPILEISLANILMDSNTVE